MSLNRCFADGQAYVALSRATNRAGLVVRNAHHALEAKVRTNATAKAFDQTGARGETWLETAQREWPAVVAKARRKRGGKWGGGRPQASRGGIGSGSASSSKRKIEGSPSAKGVAPIFAGASGSASSTKRKIEGSPAAKGVAPIFEHAAASPRGQVATSSPVSARATGVTSESPTKRTPQQIEARRQQALWKKRRSSEGGGSVVRR